MLDSLLKAGAQPDVNVLPAAPPHVSALFMATQHGHETVARRLVMAGVNANFKHPKKERTVLHEAIWGVMGYSRMS